MTRPTATLLAFSLAFAAAAGWDGAAAHAGEPVRVAAKPDSVEVGSVLFRATVSVERLDALATSSEALRLRVAFKNLSADRDLLYTAGAARNAEIRDDLGNRLLFRATDRTDHTIAPLASMEATFDVGIASTKASKIGLRWPLASVGLGDGAASVAFEFDVAGILPTPPAPDPKSQDPELRQPSSPKNAAPPSAGGEESWTYEDLVSHLRANGFRGLTTSRAVEGLMLDVPGRPSVYCQLRRSAEDAQAAAAQTRGIPRGAPGAGYAVAWRRFYFAGDADTVVTLFTALPKPQPSRIDEDPCDCQ